MKTIVLFCVAILFGAYNIQAQEPTTTALVLGPDGTYSYEKVFEVPGKSKADIYDAIKPWVVKNVKTLTNTNDFDDKEKSNISATVANLWTSGKLNVTYDYKLNIEIKDGKYRLSASSFICHNFFSPATSLSMKAGHPMGYNKKTMRGLIGDIDATFAQMLVDIQNAVTKKSEW